MNMSRFLDTSKNEAVFVKAVRPTKRETEMNVNTMNFFTDIDYVRVLK